MASSSHLPALPARLSRAARNALTLAQAAAFWAGVLIPLAYVPVLVVVDYARTDALPLLVPLVAVNAMACVLGHGHDPRP